MVTRTRRPLSPGELETMRREMKRASLRPLGVTILAGLLTADGVSSILVAVFLAMVEIIFSTHASRVPFLWASENIDVVRPLEWQRVGVGCRRNLQLTVSSTIDLYHCSVLAVSVCVSSGPSGTCYLSRPKLLGASRCTWRR